MQLSIPVLHGIVDTRFGEASPPELTRIAMTAGMAVGQRVVATGGQAVIDAEFQPSADDLSFGQLDQGRMDGDGQAPFDGSLGRQIGHGLKGLDVFGAAIGIAAVVDGIDANEQVARIESFGPGQRKREEDGISRRHISYGNGWG